MQQRHYRLGLAAFLIGLSLVSSPAIAQRRGGLQVLGLRAPDGDDEAASAASTALRQAARAAGYLVPDGSPALEQEIAAFGCDMTVNDQCLAQIATDLDSPKIIYGSVQRQGRGAQAQVIIEVSLWDRATGRQVHRDSATVPRSSSRDSDALREVARRLMTSITQGEPDSATPVVPTNNTNNNNTVVTGPGPIITPPIITPPRSHIVRYIGFGAVGVGVVLGAIGVVEWISSSAQSGSARDATDSTAGPYGAWARFENSMNRDRTRSVSDVCSAAQAQAGRSTDAREVNDLCSSNATARLLAFTLGAAGAVIAGVGAVLVLTDRSGTSREQSPAPTASPRAGLSTLQVSPIVTQTTGGLRLGFSF